MKRNSFIRRGSVSLLLSGMLAFCSFPVTAAVTLAQALDEPAEETDTAESETQESETQESEMPESETQESETQESETPESETPERRKAALLLPGIASPEKVQKRRRR